MAAPKAVRLPSNATRWPSPLKAPAAETAPMAAGGWPVAAATSRPASWVCRLKVGKSKRKLLPSASAPVTRAVLPSIVALTLRSASAFIVPDDAAVGRNRTDLAVE